MAIDTTDQTTQFAAEDGGATLSADDAEIPIEEEELEVSGTAPQQGAAKTPGQTRQKGTGGSRKDRRSSYADGLRKQITEEVSGSFRNELSTLKTEFSRMLDGIRQQSAPQQQRQQVPQADPFAQQLADIDAAREAELKLLSAHDRTKGAFDFTRYRKLENDRTALLARREAMGVLQQMGLTQQAIQQMRQGRQGGSDIDVIYKARFDRLQEEFPFLQDGNIAGQVGAYRRYLRQSGRPDTFEVDREAVLHVAAQRGIQIKPVPRGDARMYQSPGPGERGGGRQPREMRLPAAVVNALDPDEQRLAAQAIFSGGEA